MRIHFSEVLLNTFIFDVCTCTFKYWKFIPGVLCPLTLGPSHLCLLIVPQSILMSLFITLLVLLLFSHERDPTVSFFLNCLRDLIDLSGFMTPLL